MRKDAETWELFLVRFNDELDKLGCGGRIRAVGDDENVIEIVDLDGKPIGTVPTRFEPSLIADVLLIAERTFEEGVAVGKARGRDEHAR